MNEKFQIIDQTRRFQQLPTRNMNKRLSHFAPSKSNKKIKVTEIKKKKVDGNRCMELYVQHLPIMKRYFEGLISLDVFKTEIQKFRRKDKDIEFFLSFKWEMFTRLNQDSALFHWFLDELEKDVEDFATYQFKGINTLFELIKSICYNEKFLAEVCKRDKIKEVITKNYFPEFILFFSQQRTALNMVLFIDQYFPSMKEALKTDIVLKQKSQNVEGLKFLDLILSSNDILNILSSWHQGFRPFSQLEFNQKLFYLSHNMGLLDVVLQYLILNFGLQDQDQVQKNYELIIYLLDKIDEKGLLLNNYFLQAVAQLQFNFQQNLRLSKKAQEFLDIIYNRCIYKTHCTYQQTVFVDMCTKGLLGVNTDFSIVLPAIIYTQENYNYADSVYDEWLQDIGEDRVKKLQQGFEQFQAYMDGEKAREIATLSTSMSKTSLIECLYHQNKIFQSSLSLEAQRFVHKLTLFSQTSEYINSINLRFTKTTQVDIHPVNENVENANKTFNLICMIGYYSTIKSAKFIQNASGALNILKSELFDNVNKPSNNREIFTRLMMALEPFSAHIKFPWIQDKNLHFLTNSFINNYYQRLSVMEKTHFIGDIYERIDKCGNQYEIDSIPVNTFTFLGKLFISANLNRLGVIKEKEILDLFSIERPRVYHPEIVSDLQHYHAEMKNRKTQPSLNSYGFFTQSTAGSFNEYIDIEALLNDSSAKEFNTL